jgi:hypothetical protein
MSKSVARVVAMTSRGRNSRYSADDLSFENSFKNG